MSPAWKWKSQKTTASQTVAIHQHKEFVTEEGEVWKKKWQRCKKKFLNSKKNTTLLKIKWTCYAPPVPRVQPLCRVSRAGPSPKCATRFHHQGLQILSRPHSPSPRTEGLHEIRGSERYPSLCSPFSNEIPWVTFCSIQGTGSQHSP